jgi:hypothetical protein
MVEYKLYRVSKAYKVVLRRKPTRLVVPFYRIYLDLIPGIIVYNGHKYAVHFLNNMIRINKVEIIAKKSSLTKIVIKYCNVIKQQYGFKVAIIYIDRETSLIGEFKEWVAK